jgi:hypothetical protein
MDKFTAFRRDVVAALRAAGVPSTLEYTHIEVPHRAMGAAVEVHLGNVNGPWEFDIVHEDEVLASSFVAPATASAAEVAKGLVEAMERSVFLNA